MGTGSFRDGNKSGKEEFGSRGGRIEDRERINDGDGGGDPTNEERGLVESMLEGALVGVGVGGIPGAVVGAAIGGIGASDADLSPGTLPTERPGRNPNDDERPALRPAVAAEEEEPVLLGDPLNLGARGNRRRTRNDVNASPVLRRGLLGV